MTRTYRDDDLANPKHHRHDGQETIDLMPQHMWEWLTTIGIIHLGSQFDILNPRVATRLVKVMMLGFCVGNAFKYRRRMGHKDGESEAKEMGKIMWYEMYACHLLDPDNHPDPRDVQ
jgi:hypothetical protein